MDCGLTFAKYAIFFINFLFAIAGVAMIAIGAVSYNKVHDYHDFLEDYMNSPTILMIAVGCVIFLIAFLGCCGAIKENTCMLYLFSLVLLLAMAAEIAIIWTAYSHKGQIEGFIDKRLDDTLAESKPNPAFYKSWDLLQRELKCCGVDAPEDWIVKGGLPNPPAACCDKPYKPYEDKTCPITGVVFKTGCKAAFKDFVSEKTFLVAGVAIGVGVFQLLSVVFACCLYSAYRRNRY